MKKQTKNIKDYLILATLVCSTFGSISYVGYKAYKHEEPSDKERSLVGVGFGISAASYVYLCFKRAKHNNCYLTNQDKDTHTPNTNNLEEKLKTKE